MVGPLVIVADCVRARFLTLKEPEVPELESGPRLIELENLVNPESQLAGKEIWENNKSGRNRSGSSVHGYDDHRSKHEEAIAKRFAGVVLQTAKNHFQGGKVILVAGIRMMSHMREQSSGQGELEFQELNKDLTKLSKKEIQSHLESAGLLP